MDRLAWAEISLGNLAHNFWEIKKLVGPTVKVMGVVKANGYGHGAGVVAKKLEQLGVDYLGVACLAEARDLRKVGVRAPILVLGYTDSRDFGRVLDLVATVNIMDQRSLGELDRLARIRGKMATVHIKVDTGMHRIGMAPEEAAKLIKNAGKFKNINIEGVFSHFANSDEKDLGFAREQLEKFNSLNAKGLIRHIANSAGALRMPQARLDMVRIGKILYGLAPSNQFKMPINLKPVLAFKTKIVQIREIGKGETVGYGRTFKAKEKMRIAAIPVGYADGFRRAPNNWGEVVVNGKKVPVLGRVSMDQATIGVSTRERVGDEVTLIGEGLSVEEVAWKIGTISYEVLTGISARVERVYNP